MLTKLKNKKVNSTKKTKAKLLQNQLFNLALRMTKLNKDLS